MNGNLGTWRKLVRWVQLAKVRRKNNNNSPVAIINLLSTFPIRMAWTMRPNSLVLTLSSDPYRLREHKLCPVNMFHQAIHWIVDVEMRPTHIAVVYLPEGNQIKNLKKKGEENAESQGFFFFLFLKSELTFVSISLSNARSPSTAPCRYSY